MAFSYQNYTGNNATTTFSIPFTYTDTSEISVTVDGVAETGLTFPSSSEVTLTSAPASGTLVQVRRTTTLTSRTVDFASGSVLTEEDLDNSNIQVFHAAQEAVDTAGDAIALDGDDKWDAESKVIKNVATPVANTDAVNKAFISTNLPNINTVAGISTEVTTVAGIASDVTAVVADQADIGIVAGLNTEIGLLGTSDAVSDMNLLATADIVSDMNTLATASNVTNMDTLAGISGDITTVSGIQANVTAVAGDEADIGTVATNITNVNTVAGIDANVTTVAGIQANVTTVAGIQANVTTVASNDANITSVADNATNINTVAGQATNLQNVTDNLSDIQNADTNAIAAAASQVAAAASAAALAGALDNFDDTYLGTMSDTDTASSASTTSTFVLGGSALTVADATGIEVGQNVSATGIPSQANVLSIDGTTVTISHVSTAAGSSVATTFQGYGVFGAFDSNIDGPSKDNDNGTVVTGALYYNTTDGEMRVYDGANWIAASAAGSASLILYEYTATAGQTTFSGSDDNSASLSYTAGNIQVVMNGIVLDPDDFTATNGTSVVLASGAALNDVLNIYAFKSFTVADTVSASAGGTFSANVAITGDLTVDTDTLYVDSTNNRVGIGTIPSTILDVEGANINFASSENGILNVFSNDATAVDKGGSISLGGNSESGSLGFAMIKGAKQSTDAGYLAFGTRSAAANSTERLRILSNGNVGIGTASPDSLLELYKAGTSELMIGSDNAGTAQLSFYEGNSSTKEGFLKYDGANNNVVLGTSGAANALVIPRDSGNVGIGNASPNTTTKLDVNGAARFGNTTDGVVIENSSGAYGIGNASYIRRDQSTGHLELVAGSTAARNMLFKTKTNGAESARITSFGDVGIGRSDPQNIVGNQWRRSCCEK